MGTSEHNHWLSQFFSDHSAGVGTILLAAALIGVGAFGDSVPLLTGGWSAFTNCLQQSQILVPMAVILGGFGIGISVLTAALRLQGIGTIRKATKKAILRDNRYSLIPSAVPLRVYVGFFGIVPAKEREFIAKMPFATEEELAVIESLKALPLVQYDNKPSDDVDINIFIFGAHYQGGLDYDQYSGQHFFQLAAQDKPSLVFVHKAADPPLKLQMKLQKRWFAVPMEWVRYSSGKDIRSEIQLAIGNILINSYRQTSMPTDMPPPVR